MAAAAGATPVVPSLNLTKQLNASQMIAATADFAKSVEVAPLAVIPFDAKLFGTAANNGQMIGEVEGTSKVAGLFNDLARRVSGRIEARRPRRTLLTPLMTRFNRKRMAS